MEQSHSFMEPEGSLPHSQVPAICPYPEPAQPSPFPHIPLPADPSQYYPPNYARVSQVVSFPHVSPPKPCIHLSPIHTTCPAHLILLDFITRTILGEEYKSLNSSLCSYYKDTNMLIIYTQYISILININLIPLHTFYVLLIHTISYSFKLFYVHLGSNIGSHITWYTLISQTLNVGLKMV